MRSIILTTSVMFPDACTQPLLTSGKSIAQFAHFFSHEKRSGQPRLDIAKHFGAKRSHSRHPITIKAPDEVVPDESAEFLARNTDPICCVAGGKFTSHTSGG